MTIKSTNISNAYIGLYNDSIYAPGDDEDETHLIDFDNWKNTAITIDYRCDFATDFVKKLQNNFFFKEYYRSYFRQINNMAFSFVKNKFDIFIQYQLSKIQKQNILIMGETLKLYHYQQRYVHTVNNNIIELYLEYIASLKFINKLEGHNIMIFCNKVSLFISMHYHYNISKIIETIKRNNVRIFKKTNILEYWMQLCLVKVYYILPEMSIFYEMVITDEISYDYDELYTTFDTKYDVMFGTTIDWNTDRKYYSNISHNLIRANILKNVHAFNASLKKSSISMMDMVFTYQRILDIEYKIYTKYIKTNFILTDALFFKKIHNNLLITKKKIKQYYINQILNLYYNLNIL